ncbi:hypothetical protein EYC80_004403 [Monilinia laxa]|uniref:Uncharacterized protein n=1 Tax=Monilinia laxa TaxID=61186 RepID=A0A5N6KN30_MONLA|nr:hypothetical protein EYC80_004403 [Monilinia laxa]
MAPKRNRDASSAHYSSELAKKARLDSADPNIGAALSASSRSVARSVRNEQEVEQDDHSDGMDADDESGNTQEEEFDTDSDTDSKDDIKDDVEDDDSNAEVPEEEKQGNDTESVITDSDEYEIDSDDFNYEEIREQRKINDTVLPVKDYDFLLIDTLSGIYDEPQSSHRHQEPDKRLDCTRHTNRLPNLVKHNGVAIFLPLHVWKSIFGSLDEITAVAVSLTSILNFCLFHEVFQEEDMIYRNCPDLLNFRPVERGETGIFAKPYPFPPAVNMEICLRDVLHTWFPSNLTWVHYGDKPKYHGPRSLKIVKRGIRRAEAEEKRVLRRMKEERHEFRREDKKERQEKRRERLDRRFWRREGRLERVAQKHEDDSDYSDSHVCFMSGCVLNYTDAHNRSVYQSSGRGSDTESGPFVEDPDDADESWTEDSELGQY